MDYKFTSRNVNIPDHDHDVVLRFPNGKEIHVQCRPSNAEGDYHGSLDIILPEDTHIVCWEGDDMEPSRASRKARQSMKKRTLECERIAKQIVMELPFGYKHD